MKLSYLSDSLGNLSFDEMLKTVSGLGVHALELTTGNWGASPHLDLDALLCSDVQRQKFCDILKRYGMKVIALNCSGNPLAFSKDMEITEKTFRLAEKLGIRKIVMMSGLPPGNSGDTTPVWVSTSWPPLTQDILKYQWEEVAVPVWRKLAGQAEECGIQKIALENHGWQLVYNPETLLRLRGEVGNIIGMNLDPSHLFWMGGDPICAARELGKAIYHVHGKDSRIERSLCDRNGVLDTKPISRFSERSWNYVAVGCGHDLQWWKEFFSVVRMCGYDGEVSLEMEDLTMDAMTGIKMSVACLKQAMGED